MLRKSAIVLMACLGAAACSSGNPKVIQASSNMPEIRLTPGMATQIELPDAAHVKSVVTGNPALVSAERADDIVNLVPKSGSGETNLIVRSVDEDGDVKLYQYRLIVPPSSQPQQ